MEHTKNSNRYSTRQIAFIGVMAAIVFVSNYIQIKIPVGINDVTRIHVANAFCLLAGIALGPVQGGLAAGIGSALYDVLDPVYITSAPFTFVFKFLMAWVAGAAAGKDRLNVKTGRALVAAFLGQATYIVLHIGKKFIVYLIQGEPINVAIGLCVSSFMTSLLNAVISVVVVGLLAPVFCKIIKTIRK
jgi:uncharacterized membrane protein